MYKKEIGPWLPPLLCYYIYRVVCPPSLFFILLFFFVVAASHLFFYSQLIHARRAAWSDMLMVRYNTIWSALEVLNLLILALVILVNLVRFLRVIFFAFLHSISYWVSYCNKYYRCFNLSLFLTFWITNSWVASYILLTAVFMSRFIG